MSIFKVNVVARNPKDESRESPPCEAVVDTGSEMTWLPADLLAAAGISPRREYTFGLAAGQTVRRKVGYAILRAEGLETNGEVVFAEPGDAALLGVQTIESFGVTVDSIGHRFVAHTRLAL